MNPRDALDQGALARAVIPDQRGHFPSLDVQIHAAQDLNRAEALIDPAQGQQRAPLLSLDGLCHPLTPFSSQAFFNAAVVQILSAVVNPSAMTSLTLSLKIACGSAARP